jgi:formamidopyrimidine-DNA glycosylase
MPELPEVETIARALQGGGRGSHGVAGRTIVSAEVRWERTIACPDVKAFRRQIKGARIESVGRRGKFLVFELGRRKLLVHLRMSGDVRVEDGDSPLTKHDHVSFTLDDGSRMVFNDARKFGRMWLVAEGHTELQKLGLEPLDAKLTACQFHGLLQARKRQLKPLLLDQTFIAGVGNIYADEALHLAKLHPLRSSVSLSEAEAGRLLDAVRSVLKEGIRRNGASIDWVYRGGDFQNHFRVYQRTGEPCPVCGTPIERITVGQRGTHFCPKCQPVPHTIKIIEGERI